MDEQAALRDFFEVYDAHHEEVSAALLEWARGHPELRAWVEGTPPEEHAERQRRSRELMRRAALDGEWEPYLEHLRTQGMTYSQAGLSFRTWFEVVAGFRRVIHPHLVEAYGGDLPRLGAVLGAVNRLLEVALATVGEAYLEAKEEQIRAQQEAIRELSTPVLPVREGLIILPLVGAIDSTRAQQITERLLRGIEAHRARLVVLDITGVPAVDSAVANHLLQTVRAARLMGATVVVTGMSAANAQTLVRIGVDLSGLNTVGDLRGGLEEADRLLGYRTVRVEPEARAD
ncbi:MAG TPA: STAS domain-containing protein [Actinomycetota bacterium]|nr:STAS domain-containing protein [Actinomycetota bacterium]